MSESQHPMSRIDLAGHKSQRISHLFDIFMSGLFTPPPAPA
jgi:hypothetical protein